MEELPPTPAETKQDVDLDFAPANESIVDPPIVDMPAVTTQQTVSTNNGVRKFDSGPHPDQTSLCPVDD